MYEKVARGHATAYLNKLPPHDRLLAWLDGAGGEMALDIFEKYCYSKKPGRVIKRLAPALSPILHSPRVLRWTRNDVTLMAIGYSNSTENQIFQLPEDVQPLYSERAVFQTNVFFEYIANDGIGTSTIIVASISHHAIARLVERGAVAPEKLQESVPLLLDMCTNVALHAYILDVGVFDLYSFMLPWNNGAFVMVFMEMDPNRESGGKERKQILSIRTYLNKEMLSMHDLERIRGFPDGVWALREEDEEIRRWLIGNARPWNFSETTLEIKELDEF
ncbi:MAG: hypothetical protein OXC63_10750 [Aestuariivita sp.]|nr:hypothetical protein [Aestuariivita sp.]MCY4345750.1 hypothetical protein [Aestuariivita sp.]